MASFINAEPRSRCLYHPVPIAYPSQLPGNVVECQRPACFQQQLFSKPQAKPKRLKDRVRWQVVFIISQLLISQPTKETLSNCFLNKYRFAVFIKPPVFTGGFFVRLCCGF